MDEPKHHKDYRAAWIEYRTNFDVDRKLELEKAMDNAQNHFGWDEFQTFKKTLEGYEEYWGFLKQKMIDDAKKKGFDLESEP